MTVAMPPGVLHGPTCNTLRMVEREGFGVKKPPENAGCRQKN